MNTGDADGVPTKTQAEAAAWLARLRSENVTDEDRSAFLHWRDADPRHAQAFEHLTTVWEIAGGLELLAPEEAGRQSRLSRRALIMGGGALVASGVGTFLLWDREQIYVTAIGEQRRVSLDDGSIVTLDTDTRIRVLMTDTRRSVRLVGGRANFKVASDVLRPFVVEAGGQEVVALGTAFDVAQAQDSTSVMLFEGLVAVQPLDRRSLHDARHMVPGDRIVRDKDGRESFDRPDMALAGAWQNGQAVFENRTLAEAVSEMNRYTQRPIVVTDRTLARTPISGVYNAKDTESFARSVGLILSASVTVSPDRILLGRIS